MQLKINGEFEDIPEKGISIIQLLEFKNVESPEMVSVQLNGTVVRRKNYENTFVSDNDEIEFLYFMGGGSR